MEKIGQFLPGKVKEKRIVEDADAKGMITFKEAMTKYVSKWTEENKTKIFDELKELYPKRTQHLILIGSPYK